MNVSTRWRVVMLVVGRFLGCMGFVIKVQSREVIGHEKGFLGRY